MSVYDAISFPRIACCGPCLNLHNTQKISGVSPDVYLGRKSILEGPRWFPRKCCTCGKATRMFTTGVAGVFR